VHAGGCMRFDRPRWSAFPDAPLAVSGLSKPMDELLPARRKALMRALRDRQVGEGPGDVALANADGR
jgi:hypothetical protein